MDLSKLFDQFNTQDSYAILFIMLIAFLFGLLLGYILRSRRVIQLRRELKEQQKELAGMKAQAEALEEQLGLKEADLKKAGFALQEAEAKAERIEDEKQALHKEIFNLNRQLDELHSADKSYEATIDELNTAIIGLQAKNKQLSETLETEEEGVESLAQMQSIYNATRQRLEAVENKMEKLAGENEHLREELDGLKSRESELSVAAGSGAFKADRLEAVEEKLARLAGENEHLRDELDGLKSSGLVVATATPDSVAAPRSIHPEPGLPDASVVEEEPEIAVKPEKPFLRDKIGDAAEIHESDDLTRIEGVGPFLEKKLNELGVYTYDEIASWDSGRVREVTQAIQYFEGRIERDNWVEQAARLAFRKQENPEAFQAKPDAMSNDPEDLKIIEGIGPKIEELLKTAGIDNWAALAEAETDLLHDILEAAGSSFRIHDPSTWPTQARLAVNGEWGVLKEYQAELFGGREPDREP